MKLYSKMRRYVAHNIAFVLLIIALSLALGSGIVVNKNKVFLGFTTKEKAVLEQYAKDILETCAETSHRPSCYDEEIPKLMGVISMEDAFKVTQLVQEKDGEYRFCHVLGHNLSAKEVKKDPSKWKEVLARCPSGVCSNGCIHGGLQERFRQESFSDEQIQNLKPDLMELCEEKQNWHPTRLEQASCYHALGHLTMYLTNADINKSTKLCNQIAIKEDGRDFSQLCFDGAFMQIFQPLEPEDFALVKGKQPKKEELYSFCTGFNGAKRGSCLSESWPLFFEEVKTPQGLVKFCSMQEDATREHRCYNGLFYVLTAQFNFDQSRIVTFCAGLPQERKGQCFANAASRFIETDWRMIDRSVSLCRAAASSNVGEACYEELLFYATYNFHPGSEESLKLCKSLPHPWQDRCFAQNGFST